MNKKNWMLIHDERLDKMLTVFRHLDQAAYSSTIILLFGLEHRVPD